jgi:hypothetical protein
MLEQLPKKTSAKTIVGSRYLRKFFIQDRFSLLLVTYYSASTLITNSWFRGLFSQGFGFSGNFKLEDWKKDRCGRKWKTNGRKAFPF